MATGGRTDPFEISIKRRATPPAFNREEIPFGLSSGRRIIDIAREIDKDVSTIYREINRNNAQINVVQYRANRAPLAYNSFYKLD